MKTFRYLFYRLYQLMISVGNKDVPEIAAIFLLAMLLNLNFYSITSISYLFGHKVDLGLDTGLKIGTCYFFLATVLYFSFVHKKKFLEIAKIYENETSKEKNIGKDFCNKLFCFVNRINDFLFLLDDKEKQGRIIDKL